ncbi:hypothetical protein [Terracidiphilus gabretensis]|jgi:hypothetical protein|uniref:hypothetical protein n=1 Tax=Terracidiphilus gabretensis TaxID=1577687 RepID=UPI00071B9CE9|nr:hypothetical protein [Terracidiphilus gabretensis]
MRTLSNLDFLELWERGAVLHPLDRALLAISMAAPGEDYGTLAAWPLGRRNVALNQLHRACFGQMLTGWVACPECSERLEFSLDAEKLYGDVQEIAGEIVIDGRRFRPLTSRDLAGVVNESNEQAAALKLMRQCCLDSGEFDGSTFSLEEIDAISEQLAQADPLAETLLELQCAECGHCWNEPLDMAAWLWTEVEARARRLLLDVHTLAATYGWSEAEILSLSEQRRGLYMEMVRA